MEFFSTEKKLHIEEKLQACITKSDYGNRKLVPAVIDKIKLDARQSLTVAHRAIALTAC